MESAVEKFVQEIGTLLTLQGDPNVPKLYSYCIPHDPIRDMSLLAMEMDAGDPLDILSLVQIDWLQRLQLVVEIVAFVERIHPMTLNDLRRQQFVLRSHRPMYIDFDDIGRIGSENEARHEAGDQSALRLYDAFIKDLLWYGNPPMASALIDSLRELYANQSLTMQDLRQYAFALSSLVDNT